MEFLRPYYKQHYGDNNDDASVFLEELHRIGNRPAWEFAGANGHAYYGFDARAKSNVNHGQKPGKWKNHRQRGGRNEKCQGAEMKNTE
jgi:hypothetical protein